jgi:hypothetical protein
LVTVNRLEIASILELQPLRIFGQRALGDRPCRSFNTSVEMSGAPQRQRFEKARGSRDLADEVHDDAGDDAN